MKYGFDIINILLRISVFAGNFKHDGCAHFYCGLTIPGYWGFILDEIKKHEGPLICW
jgi:hypothetical protein